ncbi:hypothetical protein HPB51_028722 [Rhipicephalus microplus]|uniref:Tick transposon n=1 Tax=Rhipicephalus microplus TaxID=6941 RepID=A0A9J6CX25_RHIMP|nr:hypothetical protein HPB51_028722 [Rhipicephalus microplus]
MLPADAATTPTASGTQTGTPTAPDVYDVAVAALRQHFASSSNVVVERHRFHRQYLSAGESVANFVTALRQQTRLHLGHISLFFFVSVDDALRDQFVAVVSSNRVCERLLL